LDLTLNLEADVAFQMFFTDSEFYRNWLFDPRRPGEPKNLSMTEWQKCTDSDDMEREITYDLFQDFVITKALINVSVSQRKCDWSVPGSVYGVDNKVTQKGPPLSDSFILTEHTRITSLEQGKCHFVIVAKVDFIKSSWLKGRIESEVWAGVSKGSEILEENFKNADKSSNNDVAPTKKPRNSSTKKSQQGNTTANINLYPENWKWSGHLILTVILLILSMLVMSLYKMVATLDKIDARLSSIEKLLNIA